MEESPKQEAPAKEAQGGNEAEEGHRAEAEGAPKEGESAEKGAQTPEERREFARLRREREAKERKTELERATKEAYERGLREGRLGSVSKNPYTGAPIADEDDLEVYETMKALEEQGKDPLRDFPAAMSEKARERRKGEAERERKEREEASRIDRELQDAAARFPQYRDRKAMASLLGDPSFRDYAEGKLGSRGLGDVIEGYLRLSGLAEKARQPLSDKKAPPPSAGKPVPDRSYGNLGKKERLEALSRLGYIRKK